MTIGVGCDILDYTSVTKLKWSSDKSVRRKIFTENELKEYSKFGESLKYLMGRFAAKEATSKCLGTGLVDGVSLLEIEILSDNNGKPNLNILGNTKNIADSLKITNWQCSISHTDNYSIAVVFAETS